MKELDWANLPFGYMKTDYNVRIYYRNEQWGALEVCSEETIPMHMAATCFLILKKLGWTLNGRKR